MASVACQTPNKCRSWLELCIIECCESTWVKHFEWRTSLNGFGHTHSKVRAGRSATHLSSNAPQTVEANGFFMSYRTASMNLYPLVVVFLFPFPSYLAWLVFVLLVRNGHTENGLFRNEIFISDTFIILLPSLNINFTNVWAGNLRVAFASTIVRSFDYRFLFFPCRRNEQICPSSEDSLRACPPWLGSRLTVSRKKNGGLCVHNNKPNAMTDERTDAPR